MFYLFQQIRSVKVGDLGLQYDKGLNYQNQNGLILISKRF